MSDEVQQNFKCSKKVKKLLHENISLTRPPTNIKLYLSSYIIEHNEQLKEYHKNLKGGEHK
jgi:hypothetical protein